MKEKKTKFIGFYVTPTEYEKFWRFINAKKAIEPTYGLSKFLREATIASLPEMERQINKIKKALLEKAKNL